MQLQNHETAANPGHTQGRGRTPVDHQQASETSPQTGAPCLQTQNENNWGSQGLASFDISEILSGGSISDFHVN